MRRQQLSLHAHTSGHGGAVGARVLGRGPWGPLVHFPFALSTGAWELGGRAAWAVARGGARLGLGGQAAGSHAAIPNTPWDPH